MAAIFFNKKFGFLQKAVFAVFFELEISIGISLSYDFGIYNYNDRLERF
jgi:hypothetical protein